MTINNDMQSKIKKIATKEGMSATKIAKALGKSKATQIYNDLTKAVNDGILSIDSTGRYDLYKKSDELIRKQKSVVKGAKIKQDIPEATENQMNGYKISSIKYKGTPMKRIVTPEGKKIRMKNDEKLLVINNQPKFSVQTAEDVIKCIHDYAMSENMAAFVIKDIAANKKITTTKDIEISDNHIVFLNIQKHNKAA